MKPIKIPNNNDVIRIAGDDDDKHFICSHCNRNLVKLTDSSGDVSYYCNNCNLSFYPEIEQIRSKSKLTTPQGRDTEVLVSTKVPNPLSQFERYPVEYKGGFKQLKDKGIRIKDYRETDGAERTISQ